MNDQSGRDGDNLVVEDNDLIQSRWKSNYSWRHNLRTIKKIWKKIKDLLEVLIDPETKLRLTSIISKYNLLDHFSENNRLNDLFWPQFDLNNLLR